MLTMSDPDTTREHWYPPRACDWEMKHGIVRVEIDGMLYLTAPNWPASYASIDREQAERQRKIAADRAARTYADRAAAHFGGIL